LRDTRRRQGGRCPGARPSPHAATGALGAADLRRRRGAGAPRDRRHAGRRGSRPRVTRRATSKLGAYAGLSGFGLVAALGPGRPEIVALTAPFLLAVGAGLALRASPRFTAEIAADERAVEGDEVGVRLTLTASATVDRLDVFVRLPSGLELARGDRATSLR